MKHLCLIFLLFPFQGYSQNNSQAFKSELDFLNSDYGTCAILNYYHSLSSAYDNIQYENCDKLKDISNLPQPQKIVYKKYNTLVEDITNSHCKLPACFFFKQNGTYSYMQNFIDYGITVPQYSTPSEIFAMIYKKMHPLLSGYNIIANSVQKKQISSIGMSICYKRDSDTGSVFFMKPEIIAFWVSTKSLEDYCSGIITVKEFYAKFHIYHAINTSFIKIQ